MVNCVAINVSVHLHEGVLATIYFLRYLTNVHMKRER